MEKSQTKNELPEGTVVRVQKLDGVVSAVTLDGNDVTSIIRPTSLLRAVKAECDLVLRHTRTGGVQWRMLSKQKPAPTATEKLVASTPVQSSWKAMSTAEVADFVKQSVKYKPKDLVIPEVSWKYLIRSALRGKNILMLGPSGCGKTMAAQALARVFKDRPHEVFNMGASQDPRGMLIGNTHFNKETGTFFAESLFVKMIQTPGAIILLDEISRAHDDAANILMSVLDENQRYLRIDEHPNTPTIPVAQGVVFIATANVGHEYTGTRVMDRALLDRFIIVEMQPMSKDAELQLLTSRFPDVETKWLAAIAEIAEHTRQQLRSEDPKISTVISTRMSVEIASLLADGFTLAEAAEVCIYPFYPAVGGVDSERTYMQQLVQKYLPTAYDDKEKPWEENKIPWETT